MQNKKRLCTHTSLQRPRLPVMHPHMLLGHGIQRVLVLGPRPRKARKTHFYGPQKIIMSSDSSLKTLDEERKRSVAGVIDLGEVVVQEERED